MKDIKEVKNLKGKKILLRLDLNVPIQDGKVLNDFRIKKILPTIRFLKDKGAKIIIISHIGRDKSETLKPVFEYLRKKLEIVFAGDILGSDVDKIIFNMKDGDIILTENLRQYRGEINNDDSFSKQVSRLGDIYVNEAFSVSHREHSSIVGIPKFLPSYFGILFGQEIRALSKSFNPQKPALFIIGGNKLKTKLPFIKKFLKIVDYLFVGGALANSFFQAQGLNIGKSFVVSNNFDLSGVLKNQKIIIPIDVIVENEENKISTKIPSEVLDDERIFDAGEKTVSRLENLLKEVKFVLFNGPLGDYEKGFDKSTEKLIKTIANSKITSIIGGGDSTAFVNKLKIEDKFTFVSTGGGAMLEFLLNETLMGIEAIKNSTK